MTSEDQNQDLAVSSIRRCRVDDRDAMLAIINAAAAAAAEAYRGIIPSDRWHVSYMPLDELNSEMAAGVRFWGYAASGELVGVMGIQSVQDVDLIRHAYVLPDHQRHGVGRALLRHLRSLSMRPTLVGTWAAAGWAVRRASKAVYSHLSFTAVRAKPNRECLHFLANSLLVAQ